jgi:hypothetical protein
METTQGSFDYKMQKNLKVGLELLLCPEAFKKTGF